MNAKFFDALQSVVSEKGITREHIEDIVKTAIECAYRKQFGTTDDMKVVFDRSSNSMKIVTKKMVVRRPDESGRQIGFEEAVKKDKDIQLGDDVEVEEDPFKVFSRIASQTAKQVMMQKIKELKKNIIFDDFKEKEGDLINGYMQRQVKKTIFVDIGYGEVEGVIPQREQSSREHFKTGDRIKAMVWTVEKTNRGPNIVLTRARPEFVAKLFEMEIPEIYDGIVRIEKIVRETGMRTKVMVSSRDRDVDCVGACVGMKGSRIQAIVREIEGERIDIIEFSRDSKTLAENALTPAKVKEVIETRTGKVIAIVENEQKMIAVGKIGHNVRLASELCGFEITVMTEEEYRNFLNSDESRSLFGQLFSDDVEDYTPLQELGLKARYIELLEKGGIFSVEDLVQKSVDDLKDIDGIGEKTAKEIWEIVDSMVDFDDDEDKSEDVEKADEGEEPSEDESK